MRIDNAQLAAFAAVISEGSFELAARHLHVTPSAISQRIKQLEERMGQVLILRAAPCRVTPAGQHLLRFSEQLSVLEAELLGELGARAEAGAPPVRLPLVINADSLDSWFPEVFEQLGEESSLLLDVRSEDQDHTEQLLREGAVIAGISTSARPIQGCRVEPLGMMRYLALAAPKLAGRCFAGGVDAAALAAAPMLRFNRRDALQGLFIAAWSDTELTPPTHFMPSTRAFQQAIRCGLGWGMHAEQFVADDLANGRLVELAPERFIDIPLYWHCWKIESSALTRVSELVRSAARRNLRPLPDGRR